jgi:hypothetical protein
MTKTDRDGRKFKDMHGLKHWGLGLEPNPMHECSSAFFCAVLLNVVVTLRIREDSVSNLDLETGYSDLRFSLFSSIPPGEFRNSGSKLGHDRFLQNPFEVIIQLSPAWHCDPPSKEAYMCLKGVKSFRSSFLTGADQSF